ncbi:PPA1309 family protein [Trueperella sp. LYQ143]|uniref:PPA1309 family protein n=1 Tax=unclassified Trueperella TaxID=2630174 RepID=UPI003982F5C8
MLDDTSAETTTAAATPSPSANTEAPSPHLPALQQVIYEIESQVARLGWDGPPRLYALVNAHEALQHTPDLRDHIDSAALANLADDAHTFLAIEQDQLPLGVDIAELLPTIEWPEEVAGAAICLEQLFLPPEYDHDIPQDPEEAAAFVAQHPHRMEVRIAAGIVREGTSWSVARMRKFDDDKNVLSGPALAPALVELLQYGFMPNPSA